MSHVHPIPFSPLALRQDMQSMPGPSQAHAARARFPIGQPDLITTNDSLQLIDQSHRLLVRPNALIPVLLQ